MEQKHDVELEGVSKTDGVGSLYTNGRGVDKMTKSQQIKEFLDSHVWTG